MSVDIVRVSKTLSKILRHKPHEYGIVLDKAGYANLNDLLRLPAFRGVDFAMIRMVVEDNDKQRFTLTQDATTRQWKIKANQGHSVEIEHLELELISSPDEIPVVVHGTDFAAWRLIEKSGLSRMKRNHIHFAVGKFGDQGVISGMRKSSQVLVYVDVPSAMQAGVTFHRSPNGVILSEGLNGVLPPRFFLKVERMDGTSIPFQKPAASSSSSPSSPPSLAPAPAGGKGKGKGKEKEEESMNFEA